MTIVESTRPVTGGVDTHLDQHVAAALDGAGVLLGVESFPATSAGYRNMHGWLARFGDVVAVGVEGTGSYGVGLAGFLHRASVKVIEVDRPNRQIGASLCRSGSTTRSIRAAMMSAETRNDPRVQPEVVQATSVTPREVV